MSTHTHQTYPLGCSLCVNACLPDMPLSLFSLCQPILIRHPPWVVPSVSTHTYQISPVGCPLCVNPYSSDMPLGLLPLSRPILISHALWAAASVSTHTYQICLLGCCFCVNPNLLDMPLGLVQDSSLNPGTGDKVTFHVATHLATVKAAEKAGGANSKYAGMIIYPCCMDSADIIYKLQHSRDRLRS